MSPHNITAGTEKTLRHSSTRTQTWGQKGMGGQRHAQAALHKGKRPGVLCAEGWVVLATELHVFEKPRLLPGLELQTVQSVEQSL